MEEVSQATDADNDGLGASQATERDPQTYDECSKVLAWSDTEKPARLKLLNVAFLVLLVGSRSYGIGRGSNPCNLANGIRSNPPFQDGSWIRLGDWKTPGPPTNSYEECHLTYQICCRGKSMLLKYYWTVSGCLTSVNHLRSVL